MVHLLRRAALEHAGSRVRETLAKHFDGGTSSVDDFPWRQQPFAVADGPGLHERASWPRLWAAGTRTKVEGQDLQGNR